MIYCYCMLLKKISKYISIFSLLLLSLPFLTKAQVMDPSISLPGAIPDIQEQVSYTVTPEIPQPNQEVTITAEAYGTDLNRAQITWYINGKSILSGIGEKKLTFTVGSLGSSNVVEVRIKPIKNGPEITKSWSFTPAQVDVLWEAHTYTPPFYKGKALYTTEADVTFVAIPNIVIEGKSVAGNNAVYKWKEDYTAYADKSGYAKNTYNFTGSILGGDTNVSVEAYSQSNPEAKGRGSTDIENENPLALYYEDHPLYGIFFNQALTDTVYTNKTQLKVALFPYFFSTKGKNSDVSYEWILNNTNLDVPATENTMLFSLSGTTLGEADIETKITSPNKIIQQANNTLAIVFGK